MLTFNQLYQALVEETLDDNTDAISLFKRSINQGMQKFGAILNRELRTKYRTFDTVQGQRYYQLPEDCIRPSDIVITNGGQDYPLEEIADSDSWNQLLADDNSTSDSPQYYHCRGQDLFGIYPLPASDGDENGTIGYESRMPRMSADDYTTGTITVTNDSAAITGSGTTFTAKMVGRALVVEDVGDQDGIVYAVDSFTDATHLTVENKYSGVTVAAVSYRIGQIPDIPEEYHESLIDYGLYRYYKRKKNRGMSRDAYNDFNAALVQCEEDYSSMSTSQYTRAKRPRRPLYRYPNRDLSVTS